MSIQDLGYLSAFDNTAPLHPCESVGESMFTLPQSFIEARFHQVEKEVNVRWNKYAPNIEFPKYELDLSDDLIKAEYQQFNQLRCKIHTDASHEVLQSYPDFLVAQNILMHHYYRQPNCVTFEHSKADDSYNCTCLDINGRKFFALEGPTAETLENFYRLLENWGVSSLVCLTGEKEGETPKCYPYWVNHTYEVGDQAYFGLPLVGPYQKKQEQWAQKPLAYLHLPDWKDHSGFDVESLVDAVNQMRVRTDKSEIIAIHCSAGVGRTGTFLAIMTLLDKIDEQLDRGILPENVELSIPETFLKLNFHRRALVAKEPQYVCLYRAVDFYLKSKIRDQDQRL